MSKSKSSAGVKPWHIAYSILGDKIDPILPYLEGLRKGLVKAGLRVSFRAYASFVVLAALIGGVIGLILGLFVGMLFFSPTLLILGPLGGFVVGSALGFGITYIWPSMSAGGRKSDMEESLPFAAAYMAILASAGMSPARIIEEMSTETDIMKGMAQEAAWVVRDVKFLGLDFLSALAKIPERSPSREVASFIEGLLATIRAGGDLRKYLLTSAEEAVAKRRLQLKGLSDTLAMFGELYVTLLVVFPLLVIVMLSIMSLIGGGGFGMPPDMMINLMTYLAIPLLGGMMIFMVNLFVPKE